MKNFPIPLKFQIPECHSFKVKKELIWDFLVVQWLRLQAPNAGGLGLISGQGTTSCRLKPKITHAMIKTQHSQIIFLFFKKELLAFY